MGACLKYFPIVTRAKEMDAAAGAFQKRSGWALSQCLFFVFSALPLWAPARLPQIGSLGVWELRFFELKDCSVLRT